MSRRFFYSKEEFESQYNDYISEGKTPAEAFRLVKANEEEDRREYDEWLEVERDSYEYDE